MVARVQFHLGFQTLWHGSVEEAEERLELALTAADGLGDSWLRTQSLVYLTILHRLLGKGDKVAAHLPQLVETLKVTDYPMYVGVSEAQAAWLHYEAGEWWEAKAKAEEALATWEVTSYPFQWLAHWVLVAVALRLERLPEAVEAAEAMLAPDQRQMAREIGALLEAAVAAWEAGDEEGAREALGRAVEVAGKHGYL